MPTAHGSGSHDEKFALKLARLLGLSIAQFNSRDDDAVAEALQLVKEELAEQLELLVEIRLGGSVLKDTHVEGLSDVDALIVLQGGDAAGLSPADLHARAGACLRARFGTSIVKDGKLALTLNLPGIELQLLPALEQDGLLKIGRRDDQEWSMIQPQVFVQKLVKLNKAMNGKLVPTIKLAKVLIARLPKAQQLQGYHLEVLATSIFGSYDGRKGLTDMLGFFFHHLPSEIMVHKEDVSGQSRYVDEYLNDLHSSRRRGCADAAERIARRMRNANRIRSIELWRDLLVRGVSAATDSRPGEP